MKSKYYFYLALICFGLFFFLSIFIINGNPIFFDMPIYEFVMQFPLKEFFLFITNFGSYYLILVFLFISFFFLKRRFTRRFLLLLSFLAAFINLGLKYFFKRPRPNIMPLVKEDTYSFPSGHMMISTTFYFLCMYFLWKGKLPKVWKISFTILFNLLILLIGLSRIYLGVHYASDIIGGFLMGLGLFSFGIFFYQIWTREKK